MCPALGAAPAQVGPPDTHVALDGEDLRSELLDAHIEVSDLTAAALEAVPKLGRAGGPFLQLEAGEWVAVRGAHCVPPGPLAPPFSSPLASFPPLWLTTPRPASPPLPGSCPHHVRLRILLLAALD